MLSMKDTPLTMVLIVICSVIFLSSMYFEDSDLGYYSAESIWDGAYWAYITSCFVHYDLIHAVFNVYWLFMLGQVLEQEIGPKKMLFITLLACVVTSGFEFLFSEDTGIGFSGVLYCFLGFMWASRNQHPSFRAFLTKELWTTFLVWLVLCWVLTLTDVWSVGNAAHISGLLLGVLLAKLFYDKKFRVGWIAIQIIIILISVLPIFYYPTSISWLSVKAYNSYESEDCQRAINYLTKAIEMDSEYAWAYYLRGFAYQDLEKQALSESDFKKAYDLDPSLFEEE